MKKNKALMSDLREAFTSLEDHYTGRITLKTSVVPAAKPIRMTAVRIRRIRDVSHMSQEVFARCLHTSRRTLEKWEHGTSRPTGAAAAVLALVEKRPEVLRELAAVG